MLSYLNGIFVRFHFAIDSGNLIKNGKKRIKGQY